MKTQDTGTSGAALIKGAGVAYKVGLGVIAAGVVMFASSLLLGGVTFSAISALLKLFGAPEDRALLPTWTSEKLEGTFFSYSASSISRVRGVSIVSESASWPN